MRDKKSGGLVVTSPKSPKYWRDTPIPDPDKSLEDLRERWPDPQERLEQLEQHYRFWVIREVLYSDLLFMTENEMLAKQAGQKRGGKTTQRKGQLHKAVAIRAWNETGQDSYTRAHERYCELCAKSGLTPWKTKLTFDRAITKHREA